MQTNLDFLDCFNNLKSTPVIFNYSPPHACKPIHFLTEVTILRINSVVHLKLFIRNFSFCISIDFKFQYTNFIQHFAVRMC